MRLVLWAAVAAIGCFLQYWILLFISAALVDPKREYNRHSGYYRWLLVSSTWHLIFVGRVRFHTKGMERIPKDRRFLLVCNHRSKLDPITSWYLLQDYDLAFVSKEENFHVPCWGRLIRRCCFLSIDRDNPRKAMETINRAANLIKDDQVSVAVYPEGTRNFGEGLLPFHNGIFKIAQKANVPVVICGISGAEKMPKNFPLHGTDIYFEVLDVIPADKVKALHGNDIGDHARELMLSFIEEHEEKKDNVNLRTV
ncbi:MAG: 1-acyl-sn-glycerol-3-phosphate acyltransferase [Lachnospiraceae bacterium]|nr:1-acyl-sn-glycerol-3-phosphate acyltransferase [Lachnospiraceae bacterium]